jgi:RNA polymerase sigma-70 factor (ECF subfamily)
MGRHAADRPAPGSSGASAGRSLQHSDLFGPNRTESPPEVEPTVVFEDLVSPHENALYQYVYKITEGDEAATESVVKETLYRAAQDPARYPQRASAVRPWLVLTARAVMRDGERLAPAGHDDRPTDRNRRDRTLGDGSPGGTTVVRALDELPGTHRDILVELFYRGVSLEEAAGVRGVPVETVKSRLYFAMRALRVVLDQQVADRHGTPPDPYPDQYGVP